MRDVIKETLAFKDLTPEEKEKRGILGRLYGPIADIVNPTRNGRAYSEELWEKVFNENEIVKELLAKGGIPGELDHPADRQEVASERIAIMMPEAPKRDDSGKLIAYFDILDTPLGKIAYQLAKYGFELGVSSRAQGEVLPNNEVDPNTYDFTCFDLVLIPSIKEARLKMTESLDTNKVTFKQALTESLETAEANDRKVMEETLKELNINLEEERTLTYKVVDADGKKVEQGGGFLDKEEAELFAAQYGGEELRVLEEEWEEEIQEEEVDVDSEIADELEIDDAEAIEIEEIENEDELIEDDVISLLSTYLDFKGDDDENDFSIKLQAEENWDDATVITIPSLPDKEYHLLVGGFISKEIEIEDGIEEIVPIEDIEEIESIPEEQDGDILSSEVVTDEQTIEDEEEANDEGSDSLLKSLQEALVEKSALEADIKSLQEKLAVNDVKVSELNEEIVRYKSAITRLSVLVNNAKGLKTQISTLEEKLKAKDQIVEKQDSKIQKLNETKEKYSLNEASLDKVITDKEAQIVKLTEELEQTKVSSTEQVTKLRENLSKAVKARNGYKQLANSAVNSYINYRATMLGVSSEEIKSKLDETYTIEDVDRICEDLQDYKLHMNRLPFDIDRKVKVKVKESKNDILNPSNPDDDIENGFLEHMIY